jgi:hypothetical protein
VRVLLGVLDPESHRAEAHLGDHQGLAIRAFWPNRVGRAFGSFFVVIFFSEVATVLEAARVVTARRAVDL